MPDRMFDSSDAGLITERQVANRVCAVVFARASVIGAIAGALSLGAFVLAILVVGAVTDGHAYEIGIIYIVFGLIVGAVVGAASGGAAATAGLIAARVSGLFTRNQKISSRSLQLVVFASTCLCISSASSILVGWWGMLVGTAVGVWAAVDLGRTWSTRTAPTSNSAGAR